MRGRGVFSGRKKKVMGEPASTSQSTVDMGGGKKEKVTLVGKATENGRKRASRQRTIREDPTRKD